MTYETTVPPTGVDPEAKKLADSYFHRGEIDSLIRLRCEWANKGCEELANGDPSNARRIARTWSYIDSLIQLDQQNERLLHRLSDVTARIEEVDQ